MNAENKCPCGMDLPDGIEICPSCVDKLQLEMYEDQMLAEEQEAETLINLMKEDGLTNFYDGSL